MFQKYLKKIKLNEKFTFLLVPHSNTSVRKFNFTKGFFCGLVCILFIFAVTVGVFISQYNSMKENMQELRYLREVNEQQKEQIDSLAAETEEIYLQMEELQRLDEKVRTILNITNKNDTSREDGEKLYVSGVSRELAKGGIVTRGNTRDYAQVLEGDLEFLQEELSSWENHLGDLINEAEKHVAFTAAKPAGWPASGRITSGYGNRQSPTGRGTEFHLGIDIANSRGTVLKATGEGRVISAGWQGGYGWTVIVDHGYGYRTLYAHASSLAVQAGDSVKRGTVIAYMGSSGRATGPHVHYEVIYKGENKDPALYLKRP